MTETLRRDLRYGIRMLVRNPGFAFAAVVTLALGIGANTAIFSVINGVLIRPLPFPQSDRLVYIWTTFPSRGPGFDSFGASYADFRDWRERSTSFEGMSVALTGVHNLTGDFEPEEVRAAAVSPNMFEVFGVAPILGRVFSAEEEQWGQHRVALLSHGLWQRRFGGDAGVVGRNFNLDGVPFRVVGVLPPTMEFPERQVEIWRPLAYAPGDSTPTPRDRGFRYLNWVMARLKPGVSIAQADQEIKAIAAELASSAPDTNAECSARVVGMVDWNSRNFRGALLILMGIVAGVLLIACVNVASLLLVRATGREREVAVRTALGARKGRLLQQLLTENVLLALVGGTVGLLLGYWAVSAIVTFGPRQRIPQLDKIHLDSRVLAFTLGCTLLTGLIFGLIPALQASGVNPQESLREGGRGSAGGPRRRRIFQILVVAEVALALIPLVGAGLLVKSFLRLQAVNIGFNPNNVLAMNLRLEPRRYQGREATFYRELVDRVTAVPGVQTAGACFRAAFPLEGGVSVWDLEVDGRPTRPDDRTIVNWSQVTPGFFRTMSIPLLRGRTFGDEDGPETLPVMMINQTLASRVFPDEDPIGKVIWLGGRGRPALTVIGVVGDTKHRSVDYPIEPMAYTAHSQGWRGASGSMWLLARTQGDPSRMASTFKEQVSTLDASIPITEVVTMEQVVNRSLADRRFIMFMIGILAAVALAMAAVGIYGVVAHSVNQRTHEIGVRLALGSQVGEAILLVVRRALALVIVGIAAGLVGAFIFTGFMSSLLFEVGRRDPVIFAGVALLLAAVAWLACYLPARRIARVDPVRALRYE